MVRLALAVLAGLAVLAPARAALAGEELWLRWEDCAPAGVPDMPFNCSVPVHSKSLYVAACPAESLAQVVAAIMVFDVVTDSANLPDWWRLGPGDCRAGKLAADVDFSASSLCTDAWGSNGGGLVQYYGTRVGGGPNQTRFIATAGVPGSASVTLPGGTPEALARVIMYLSDAPTSACQGCAVGACIVLNSVELVRLPGAPGGDMTLYQPGEAGSNFATWRSGAACVAVPVLNRSWGQVKALYR